MVNRKRKISQWNIRKAPLFVWNIFYVKPFYTLQPWNVKNIILYPSVIKQGIVGIGVRRIENIKYL